MNRFRICLVLMALLALSGCQNGSPALNVQNLRCEFRTDPLGVDAPQPRLTWTLASSQRGAMQSTYQILVASSPELLKADRADFWDSGIVQSDETAHLLYNGKPLPSAQQVYWKARSWDSDRRASAWSEPASWTMGLNSDADWSSAKWITAPTDPKLAGLLMRKQFDVKPRLKRANAYICGLGQYVMSINGKKVGEDLLTPGWTKYDKTCLYDTYDVTAMLTSGANATGLMLGNGMYNVIGTRYTKFKGTFGPQKAIGIIRLEYADGTIQQIGTDESWRVTTGPITYSCVYGGEDYDARLEQKGWDQPTFDDSGWQTASATTGPGGMLRGISYAAPPIRTIESFVPVQTGDVSPTVAVYDLKQNASMMVQIRVKGPAGASVKLIPSELLRANGTIDPTSTRNGPAWWQYTLKGDGSETWMTKFFYHGCRYLQVEITPASPGGELPVVEEIKGIVTHSTADAIGEFACSSELFNRIRTLVRWAQRSNMVSVLTDCPHRERLGWMEQAYLNGPSLRYEFDLAQFFAKCMNDMADSQTTDGLIPDIAPEYTKFDGGFRDSPEWGSAFILCAWQNYQWTGDASLLARYYEPMKKYVAYLTGKSKDHLVSHGLGDWYDIGPARPGRAQLTPLSVTATAIYYTDIKVMEQAARMLGKESDAKEFATLGAAVRDAYIKTHYKPETGVFATGSQTANAMSLALGLCDDDKAGRVVDAIVKDIQQRGNALTTGDVGYTYLLAALASAGRSDVIYAMNNQSEKPGYGYQLAKGATALTEAWDARASSSQNHFMLGHIMEWFYRDLAGIQMDPSSPGFKKIIIKPTIAGDLTWAKGSYNSIRGPIKSEWKLDGKRFALKVSIPANTTATVYVPTSDALSISESGIPVSRSSGIRLIHTEPARAVLEIGSGEYEFSSTVSETR